jgi:hypothetical protein
MKKNFNLSFCPLTKLKPTKKYEKFIEQETTTTTLISQSKNE